jgi:hypothetical protein
MIVERWTWTAKVGRKQEAIEAIKALLALNGFGGRVCTHRSGPYFAVTWYQEFETMEDRQKVRDAIDWSRPEVREALKKHQDTIESDATRELLQVH